MGLHGEMGHGWARHAGETERAEQGDPEGGGGVGSGKRLERPKGHAGEGEPCQQELPWGQNSPGPWGVQANSSWQQARVMEQTRGSRD